VIHLAFKHDIAFSGNFAGAATADRRAIETFGEALAGSDRPFLIASGTLGLAPGRVATERDGTPESDAQLPFSGAEARLANAHLALSIAGRGVRSSVVRLPPTCHGNGDDGFMAFIVGIARDKGVSGYVGDGSNRWPAVHRLDAAPPTAWLGTDASRAHRRSRPGALLPSPVRMTKYRRSAR